MPNLPVDTDSWGRSACYPRSTFYQISDAPSIRKRRITKPCFRICSTLRSRSQAPLYLCALRAIANRTEGTFGLLRYPLGGYRPSKTAHLARSHGRITVVVRNLSRSGWYFTDGSARARTRTSAPPSYATQTRTSSNTRLQSRFTGSFRLAAGTRHLHRDCNFAESLVETVKRLLHDSCGSELTRQGISLP